MLFHLYFSCVSKMLKSKRSGVFALMRLFFFTFKEGPAQPPQGVLQNLKVLHIKVEKALMKARGKKIFVCLSSRGL